MKKFTLLLVALVATVWVNAADVLVDACDFTAKLDSNAQYTGTWEYGGYTIENGANNNGAWAYVKFGKKSLSTATTCSVKSPKMAKQIDKITVNFNAGNLTKGACADWGVEVYDSTFTTLVEKVTGSAMPKTTATSIDLLPSTAGKWAAKSCYKIYFNCTNSTTTNGVVWVNSIEFFESVAAAVEDPTFNIAGGTFFSAQSVSLSCVTTGATIYYTTDGTTPDATKTQYNAPINVATTTTIKAIAIKGTDKSNVVEETYAIVNNAGTQDNPYTVEDALAIQSKDGKVWVEGYIIGGINSNGTAISNTVISAIAIADNANEDNVDNMATVQLPSGDIRDALNVNQNPLNIGLRVKVYGDLTAYLNHPGIKNTSQYVLENMTAIESITAPNTIYGAHGRIYGIENGRIYNLLGIDVTEQNGTLNGIYIVKLANGKTQKLQVK